MAKHEVFITFRTEWSGSELKAFRDKYKLTQKDIADLLGIHVPNVAHIEAGRRSATPVYRHFLAFITFLLESKRIDVNDLREFAAKFSVSDREQNPQA